MKIALIVPGFSTNESDWAIPVLLHSVRALAKAHDVHVFTLRHPPEQRQYEVFGATVHAIGGGTTSGLRRIPLLRRAYAAILRESRRKPFAVLHGLWADEPGFVAVLAGRRLRIPVVVSILGGEFVRMPAIAYGHQLSFSARWMIRASLRLADRITVGSAYLQQIASEQVPSAKLVQTPLGVDVDLFTPSVRQSEGQCFKLLHVASLTPIKNQRLLLNTLALVKNQLENVQLHIIGDGPLRQDLERQAAHLNIREAVHFHGYVPHDQLTDHYRAADLCLLTSYFESQSMTALEAAACARITIGTDVGILRELPGREWLVSQPHNPAPLADHILNLLRNTRLRNERGRQACQQILDDYTIDRAVSRWLHLYTSA